ncbi:hypothetical protein LCGC14_0564860 [marine sediment metagenome]|uniref:Uncharacterized protein n=1 Tax=marine sediment metagenome TaxID=412755 RepID=A0A0F9UU46_9ZZZZ
MAAAPGDFNPVRLGNWSTLKVVVFGTPGAEGAQTANRIEVPLTVETDDGQAVAEQIVYTVRVSDTELAAASSSAVIYVADSPVGAILEGSGTATVRVQTTAAGALTLAIEETSGSSGTPARRFLSVAATFGSKSYLRSDAASLTLSFT